MAEQRLLKAVAIAIDRIYIPTALRQPVDPKKLEEIAVSIAEIGQQTPILVRTDKERYVLVSGLHRLEACRALGETTILANLVQARKH
jgi:ParB-like chromosome segregation protein Spo0J